MKIFAVTLAKCYYEEFEELPYWECDNLDEAPCYAEFWQTMRQYFEIAKRRAIERVHLTLHSLPSKYRVPIEVVEAGEWEPYPRLVFDNAAVFDDNELDEPLKPYIGKTVYLEMEYTV